MKASFEHFPHPFVLCIFLIVSIFLTISLQLPHLFLRSRDRYTSQTPQALIFTKKKYTIENRGTNLLGKKLLLTVILLYQMWCTKSKTLSQPTSNRTVSNIVNDHNRCFLNKVRSNSKTRNTSEQQ